MVYIIHRYTATTLITERVTKAIYMCTWACMQE